jgi:hypothetical protein
MDTHRPPHFDGTNFSYYSARMACYLEAVDLGVWRVTRECNTTGVYFSFDHEYGFKQELSVRILASMP